MSHIDKTVAALLDTDSWKATKYLSERQIIRATRRTYKHRIDKRNRSINVVLTIGVPNYAEREFIKRCKKAGEPFPVRKIQLKALPKPR